MATISSAIPPNQTLYVNNLNDKICKPDLRISLYTLFSTYGVVLDIVALKTPRHRGQAHIAFRDVTSATQAMRALQGMDVFGREMKITYAKSKSNKIAKLDGTFKIPVVTQGGLQDSSEAKPFVPFPGASTTNAPTPTSTTATAPDAAVVGQKRLRDEKTEESEDEEMDMEVEEDDD